MKLLALDRVVVWAALASMGCSAATVVAAQASPVATLAVQSRNAGASTSLEGVIQPVKQSMVSAQATGRIVSMQVKAGDRVRAGQLLATIDDRDAVAGVQRSQAQINQADAEMRNAKANFERTKDLQSKGFVSKAALDTAEMQLKSATAAREQATAVAAQTGLAQGFTRVTSPMDGWILQTLAEAGDLAVPGKPLLHVYAPQPLRAVVQVPGSKVQSTRTAAQTQVIADDTSGAALAMTPVSRTIVPAADPVTQTTEWRLELSAKDSANLVPGQPVRVQFGLAQADTKASLTVPANSIVRRGELTAVYVVAGQRFSLRAVRLGNTNGAEGVEVVSGLRSGEVIARDGIAAGLANATPAPAAQ